MRFILLALLCMLFIAPAEARRHRYVNVSPECNVTMPCDFSYLKKPISRIAVEGHRRYFKPAKAVPKMATAPARERGEQVRIKPDIRETLLSHPDGCPVRAFCGCGAAVRIFGRPIRSLWTAASWFRFPRAEPAPGMAAVRRHHVFVLEAHISGNMWLAFDANSGRHLTRIHARSIAGYTIVDPHKG